MPETKQTILNPSAHRARQLILTRNAIGRNVVEPAVQKRGSYVAIDASIFLRDTYGDYPADAKAAIHRILESYPSLSEAR